MNTQHQRTLPIRGVLDVTAMKLLANCASGLLSGVGPLTPEQYLDQLMCQSGYLDNGIASVEVASLTMDDFGIGLKVQFRFMGPEGLHDTGNFYIKVENGALTGEF